MQLIEMRILYFENSGVWFHPWQLKGKSLLSSTALLATWDSALQRMSTEELWGSISQPFFLTHTSCHQRNVVGSTFPLAERAYQSWAGGGGRQVIYTVLRSFSQRCLPAACSHPPPLRLKHYCATGVHLEHGGEGERHQYAQGSEERGQRLNYLFLLSLLIFLRAGGNLARISTINKL